METAIQAQSKLNMMLSPARSKADLTAALQGLSSLPAQKGTDGALGAVYGTFLKDQPIESVKRAVVKYMARPDSEFRPAPGVLLDLTQKDANRVRIKLRQLTEAIDEAGQS